MGTKALAITKPAEDGFDPQRLAEAGIAAIELEQLNYAATANAKAIALQVGYDGSLSVGALEDEIRFYQRRTVEACLELGKRLLVLKELTPHGEFLPRLEMLGFTALSAQRLMRTTAKTAKSVNLTHLSTQVKSMSAFMELLTHDEDVLENLAEMDDVDKMSASDLRKAVRALTQDADANDKVLADKSKKIDSLERKLKKQVGVLTNWPEAFETLVTQVDHSGTRIRHHIGALEQFRLAAMQVEAAEGEEGSLDQARKLIASKLQASIAQAQIELDAVNHSFEQTLGAWAEGEATNAAAE
jgi:Protein of unknown function (DUF3102)